MSRRAMTGHIIVDTTNGGAFGCEHCGARMRLALPCMAQDWADACTAFIERHKQCLSANTDAEECDGTHTHGPCADPKC